jgi:multimeric flavodoxin WrbA
MKNILVLNGAPRKTGETAKLLAAFIDGAERAGHHIESFYLQDMNIHGCTGCLGCSKLPKGCDNPCVQKDDMVEIYAAFMKADMVAFVSPVYFFSISGPLKTATDRLYAAVRNLGNKGFEREGVLLMTAGGSDYSQPIRWFEHLEKYCNWKNSGMVLGNGKTEEARNLGSSV